MRDLNIMLVFLFGAYIPSAIIRDNWFAVVGYSILVILNLGVAIILSTKNKGVIR